jgi:hypothetical protein
VLVPKLLRGPPTRRQELLPAAQVETGDGPDPHFSIRINWTGGLAPGTEAANARFPSMPVYRIDFFDDAEAIECDLPTLEGVLRDTFGALVEVVRHWAVEEGTRIAKAAIYDREGRRVGQVQVQVQVSIGGGSAA